MSEFKDYTTMLEEKKINAKKKRDELKKKRDELKYVERLATYKMRDENEDIIRHIRENFTSEELAKKVYLRQQYHNKEIGKKVTRFHEDDKNGIIEHKLNLLETMVEVLKEKLDEFEESQKGAYNGLEMDIDYIKGVVMNMDARLDMLEGKPPFPYSKIFDA